MFVDVPDPKVITCKVVDPSGTQLKTEFAPQFSAGFIEVLLTPEMAGFHNINLFYEGSPITGTSPFQTNPAPYAEIIGESNRNDAVAGDDYVVKLSSINCKVGDFKFAVKGPSSFGSTAAPTVIASLGLDPSKDAGIGVKFFKDNKPANPNGSENGQWDIKFATKFPGVFTLLVFLNGKPIKGCPVTINVASDASTAKGGGAQKVVLCSDVDNVTPVNATSPREPTSPKTISSSPVTVSSQPSTTAKKGPVTITAVSVKANVTNEPEQPSSATKSSSRREHRDKSDKGEEGDKVHRSQSKKSHKSRDKSEKK